MRVYCNTAHFKRVKQGASYTLVPKGVYGYNSLKDSLDKLYSKSDFHQNVNCGEDDKASTQGHTTIGLRVLEHPPELLAHYLFISIKLLSTTNLYIYKQLV